MHNAENVYFHQIITKLYVIFVTRDMCGILNSPYSQMWHQGMDACVCVGGEGGREGITSLYGAWAIPSQCDFA